MTWEAAISLAVGRVVLFGGGLLAATALVSWCCNLAWKRWKDNHAFFGACYYYWTKHRKTTNSGRWEWKETVS